MSTSPHRIHHDLYRGPKILKDPGNAGIIRFNQDLQVCELVTGASGETRTLANPTKPGIRAHIRLLTDGGGDAVITAPNGLNAALDTVATLGDAGDFLELISVTLVANTSYRWEALLQSGVAISSTSPSATPSSSPSASASSSPSSSASSSPSAT